MKFLNLVAINSYRAWTSIQSLKPRPNIMIGVY
jgi:hypothetical protein